MILTDCHLHTSYSGDCEIKMEQMIQAGIRLGLKTMCFTDHFDPDYPIIPGEDISFDLDITSYQKEFLRLKEQYHNKIELLFGIEFGLQPHLKEMFSDFIKSYPFDFIIGSSHLLDGSDPYYPDTLNYPDDNALYLAYFESIYENVMTFDHFQSYGHLDYIVRYGRNKTDSYDPFKYMDLFDSILKKMIEKGIGPELNTSGMKYGLGFPHPHSAILKRYKELGGEILTIGSDAHKPEHIAYSFDSVSSYLQSLGYKYYTIFKNQKPEFIPLS